MRLTQKDEQGNWMVKGLPWEQMKPGQEITQLTWERLYGALCKLKDYEDTGCTPEEVISLKEFDGSNTQKLLMEIAKHKWNPIEERLPSDDRYILLSFENFSLPLVGHYKDGAFYLGDCDDEDTCLENDLFVNAWMELPKSYGRRVAMGEATMSAGTCSMDIEYCGDCPFENTENCDFKEVEEEE